MYCPICSSRLEPVGSSMVESIDTSDGMQMSVQSTYQCRNAECESVAEGYVWAFNGETFIMHHMERHLEAA